MTGNVSDVNNLKILKGKIRNLSPYALDTTLSVEGASAEAKATGEAIEAAKNAVQNNLDTHAGDKNNPHNVTKKQLGIENVDNTADADKPISTATAAALALKVDVVEGKGLSANDFTDDFKTKLEGLENYSLPVGGEALGGVKNGDVVISDDGSMVIPDGTLSREKMAADTKIISVSNTTVPTTDWAEDTTYTDYGFRAAIAIEGVTEKHYPQVVFAPAEALSGSFSTISETYDGGVYIFADSIPATDIVIPTIVCTPLS